MSTARATEKTSKKYVLPESAAATRANILVQTTSIKKKEMKNQIRKQHKAGLYKERKRVPRMNLVRKRRRQKTTVLYTLLF